MDPAKLRKWGRRSVIVGIVLIPFDVVIVTAFIVVARDPIATFSLTMFLVALTAVCIGFGAAAISSGNPENRGDAEKREGPD